MEDFYIEKKIYYHDTDCGGVVYYANYLEYFEEGRTEYCLSKGVDLKALAEKGTYFVVAAVHINYKSPARYQDIIKVITRIEKIGTASMYFFQRALRDNVILTEAKITLVCVGKDFKPKPIPNEVNQCLL